MDEDKVKEIFTAGDTNGNGVLTVEEFGKALYEGIKDMKFDGEN